MDGLAAHPGFFCQFRLAEAVVGRVHQRVDHVAHGVVLGENAPATRVLIPKFCYLLVTARSSLSTRHTLTEDSGVLNSLDTLCRFLILVQHGNQTRPSRTDQHPSF
jgi:hypothetical protein